MMIRQFIWAGLVSIIFARDCIRWDDAVGRMEYDHDVKLHKLWKSSLGTLAFLWLGGMLLIGGR